MNTAIASETPKPRKRDKTGLDFFDHLMNGGLVRGSMTLLVGPCGVGKSTLALQVLDGLARSKRSGLYATGEMTVDDMREITRRIGIENENVAIASEGDVYEIENGVKCGKHKALVVDSIQTAYCRDANGSVGSATQTRAVMNYLSSSAELHKITTIVIGHLRKDGEIAGSSNIECLADAVVRVTPWSDPEDEKTRHRCRISLDKYRFGSTDVEAFVEMTPTGMVAWK